MFRRLRTQLKAKPPSHQHTDEDERLLAAIELDDIPTAAASPPVNQVSAPDTSTPTKKCHRCPHETSSLRRIASFLPSVQLGKCIEALRPRRQRHGRNGWANNLPDREELKSCYLCNADPEMRSGRMQGKRRRTGADAGLWSTATWYFWSPAETGKDCPTLEFLRIHLAPPNVWL